MRSQGQNRDGAQDDAPAPSAAGRKGADNDLPRANAGDQHQPQVTADHPDCRTPRPSPRARRRAPSTPGRPRPPRKTTLPPWPSGRPGSSRAATRRPTTPLRGPSKQRADHHRPRRIKPALPRTRRPSHSNTGPNSIARFPDQVNAPRLDQLRSGRRDEFALRCKVDARKIS